MFMFSCEWTASSWTFTRSIARTNSTSGHATVNAFCSQKSVPVRTLVHQDNWYNNNVLVWGDTRRLLFMIIYCTADTIHSPVPNYSVFS
jgi:hypothetical protein